VENVVTKPDHIFVVGVSRSGTNMMRRVLNSSPEIEICGETHFLSHWFGYKGFKHEFAQVADIKTDTGVRKLADYIYNIKSNKSRGRGYWRRIHRELERDQFLEMILASERTEWTPLDLLMEVNAGSKIRGEKTPGHIHRVPELLEHYPKAKVIHMLRDPRAIFISSKRWQATYEYVTWPYRILRHSDLVLGIFVSLHTMVIWLRAVQLHHSYRRLYSDRYHLCRFESLVTNPEAEITRLCEFLEIDYTEDMLEISYQNSTVSQKQQSKGYDTSTVERWRQYLNPAMHKWLLLWCKKRLLEFGYHI
jgi:hypothetical protein